MRTGVGSNANANATTTRYAYDALGRRISKTSERDQQQNTTTFYWNGDVLLGEINSNTKPSRTYLFEPFSFKPLALVQHGQVYHYHTDHIDTPREITNARAEVVWSSTFKTYGALALAHVNEVDNPLRFQGQYYDEETGLHYNRRRYYDPNSGQFTTQDPIGLLGGMNAYQYAPNPMTWVDPWGLSCKKGNESEFSGDSRTSPWLSDKRVGVVSHLETFRGGGSYLIPQSAYERFVAGKPMAGDPTGQFITTKSAMDKLLGKANGSLDFIKKELSIPENAWNEELMRVDVHNPLLHNARFPSGFERGANELFKWGGYTKGGMPEIVVDQFPIGGYSANTIGVKP